MLQGGEKNKHVVVDAQYVKLTPTIFPNPANGDDLYVDYKLGIDVKELVTDVTQAPMER
jgi:hypothetical protein